MNAQGHKQSKKMFALIFLLCTVVILFFFYQNKYELLMYVSEYTPDDQMNCIIPLLSNIEDFPNFGKRHGKMSCTHLAELGGLSRYYKEIYPYNEGARMVCLDGINRGNCTVLSFGIGTDVTFDYDVDDVVECNIFMFDPTPAYDRFEDGRKMKFFHLGLSDKNGTVKIKGIPRNVDRYGSILQMLNLTDHIIDYLKIDIETSELNFFNDIFNSSPQLLNNVRQIGMEIHPIIYKNMQGNLSFVDAFSPFWEALHRLECLGFEMISFIPYLYGICKFSYNGKELPGCYDIEFLRKNKL